MKLSLLAPLAVSGIILAGCTEQSSTTESANPDEVAQEVSAPEAPDAAYEAVESPQSLGIGETANTGGLRLTLEEAYLEPPGLYDEMNDGQFYLLAKFRVENDTEIAFDLGGSGLDFFAFNQDSYDLDLGVTNSQITSPDRTDRDLIGTARPGADRIGTVAFIVERETDEVVVEYSPMTGAASSALWNLGAVRDLPVQNEDGSVITEQYG